MGEEDLPRLFIEGILQPNLFQKSAGQSHHHRLFVIAIDLAGGGQGAEDLTGEVLDFLVGGAHEFVSGSIARPAYNLTSVRAVVQRVSSARVVVASQRVAEIGHGLLVLLGVRKGDGARDLEGMAEKVLNLRIFDDSQGVMNLSVQDVAGEILVVSQFTLLADSRKGRRPSYIDAASPDEAKPLYEAFCERLAASGRPIQRGVFQAMMAVSLVNDGPVTILLDSEKKF